MPVVPWSIARITDGFSRSSERVTPRVYVRRVEPVAAPRRSRGGSARPAARRRARRAARRCACSSPATSCSAGASRRSRRPTRKGSSPASATRSRSADLAVANLESPLTLRPHLPAFGPNALEARPASATLLAGGGIRRDRDRQQPRRRCRSAHRDRHDRGALPGGARRPRRGLVGRGGVRAEDRRGGPRPRRAARVRRDRPGPPRRSRDARGRLRGTSGSCAPPCSARAARPTSSRSASRAAPSTCRRPTRTSCTSHGRLAAWGADVVWGQGPHVVQPIRVLHVRRDGRPTIVATSLGNLLFDQHIPGTQQGALLEVLAGAGGVRAFRIGSTCDADARRCSSSAGSCRRETRPRSAATGGRSRAASRRPRQQRRRIARGLPGDGRRRGGRRSGRERRPPARRRLPPSLPAHEHQRARLRGASSSTGTGSPPTSASTARHDLQPLWVAGTLLRPVAAVAACDGALAVGYSTLNEQRDRRHRRLALGRLRLPHAARAPGSRRRGVRERRRQARPGRARKELTMTRHRFLSALLLAARGRARRWRRPAAARASTAATTTLAAKPRLALPTSAVRFGAYDVVPLLGAARPRTPGLRRRTRSPASRSCRPSSKRPEEPRRRRGAREERLRRRPGATSACSSTRTRATCTAAGPCS